MKQNSCKKSILLLLLLFSRIGLQAQTDVQNGVNLSSFVPASPEAATVAKYGSATLNLHTGTPNIQIPLLEFSSRDIKIPIGLSYSSSGTKTEELPSRTGLGWTINGGGVITRSVRSRPDEKPNGYINRQKEPDFMNELLNGNFDEPRSYLLAKEAGSNRQDTHPDIFYVDAPGLSAKFFFDQSGSIHCIPENKLTIEYETKGQYDDIYIRKFTITTIDGFKYYFGDQTASGGRAFEEVNMNELSISYNQHHNYSIINAWYLVRIVSPLEAEVQFDYYERNYDYKYINAETRYTFIDLVPPANLDYRDAWNKIDPPSKVPASYIGAEQKFMQALSLKEITGETGKIIFHESIERLDQPGLYQLDGITAINCLGHEVKHYSLQYNCNNGKLQLEKLVEGHPGAINELDGTLLNNKEYLFDYFPGKLPDRNSFSKDHWGYFNGRDNQTLVPPAVVQTGITYPNTTHQYQDVYLEGADRYPNLSAAVTGVLQKITYPTGGSTEYEYEQNTESSYPHEYSVQEDAIFLSSNAAFNSQQNVSGNFTHTYTELFRINNAVRDRKTRLAVNTYGLGNVHTQTTLQVTIERNTGNGNFQKEVVILYNTTEIFLTDGEYRLKVEKAGSDNNQDYQVLLSWKNDTEIFYAGGIRVKRTINRDPFTNGSGEIMRYEYLQDDAQTSSGHMQGLPEYGYEMADVYSMPDPINIAMPTSHPYQIRYWIRFATSNLPMFFAEGSPIGYGKVTAYTGENGEGGKTENYFTTSSEYPDDQYLQFPFGEGKNHEFMRGRLLRQDIYRKTDNGFEKIKTEEFLTNENELVQVPTLKVGFNPQIREQSYPPVPTSFGVQLQAGQVQTAVVHEIQHSSALYDPALPGISAGNIDKVDTHNQINDLPSHTISIKNNDIEEHIYTIYPSDLMTNTNIQPGDFPTAGLRRLILSGAYTSPIEILKAKRINGELYITGGILKTYNAFLPLPDAEYILDLDAPVELNRFNKCRLISTPSRKGVTLFSFDSRYRKTKSINVYDENGNPLEQKKANDITKMYIWDYNKTMPVAEILFPKAKMPNPFPYNERMASTTGNGMQSVDDAFADDTINTNGIKLPGISSFQPNTVAKPSPSYSSYQPYCAYSSFETPDGGNWLGMDENYLKQSPDAVTGSNIYILLSELRFDHLLEDETYYITCWSKDGSERPLLYSFPQQMNSVPNELTTRNGWTLLRYEISNCSNVLFKANGAIIDELRLYPKEGRISTYTYEPMIGITSSCDENNNVTYYEYDHLGRLATIRDKDKHLVKTFDYKFKQP